MTSSLVYLKIELYSLKDQLVNTLHHYFVRNYYFWNHRIAKKILPFI